MPKMYFLGNQKDGEMNGGHKSKKREKENSDEKQSDDEGNGSVLNGLTWGLGARIVWRSLQSVAVSPSTDGQEKNKNRPLPIHSPRFLARSTLGGHLGAGSTNHGLSMSTYSLREMLHSRGDMRSVKPLCPLSFSHILSVYRQA